MTGPVTGLATEGAVVRRGDFTVTASFTTAPGEILAVVGGNGSGKTTLLHAVTGLIPLEAGRIELAGRVLDDVAARTWVPTQDRGVALVHQQHLLFGHLSALENVAFGLRARGVHRREALAEAAEWLARLDLTKQARLRADRLSGGQSQRVALARAACSRPRALLLDEPFAALDERARAEVGELVAGLVADLRVPCLLISHDAAEVDRLAHAVVRLEAGRVV